MHLKAFDVKKLLIKVIAIDLSMGQIFLPRGSIFSPKILKWLFVIKIWLIVFIVVIYIIINQNMYDNIDLCNGKALIFEFINCKWGENVVAIIILNNAIVFEKIIFVASLQHLFNLLLALSMKKKRIICYYAQNLSKLIWFCTINTNCILPMQNGVVNAVYSTSIQTQINLDIDHLRTIYCNFVCNSCCIMILLCNSSQYQDSYQHYYHSNSIEDQISSGVCLARILLIKLLTNIVELINTMHRWSGCVQMHFIPMVYWCISSSITKNKMNMNKLTRIIWSNYLFHCEFNVIQINHVGLLSSIVQPNDECHVQLWLTPTMVLTISTAMTTIQLIQV